MIEHVYVIKISRENLWKDENWRDIDNPKYAKSFKDKYLATLWRNSMARQEGYETENFTLDQYFAVVPYYKKSRKKYKYLLEENPLKIAMILSRKKVREREMLQFTYFLSYIRYTKISNFLHVLNLISENKEIEEIPNSRSIENWRNEFKINS